MERRHRRESGEPVAHTAAWSQGWLPATRLSLGRKKTLRNKRLCNAQRSNLRLTSRADMLLHPIAFPTLLDFQGDARAGIGSPVVPPHSCRKASPIPPAANILQAPGAAWKKPLRGGRKEENPAPSAGQRCMQVPPRSPTKKKNPSRFDTHIATAGLLPPEPAIIYCNCITTAAVPKFYGRAAF